MQPSPKLIKAITWLISIAVLIILVLGAVRIVLNPWYVHFAYEVVGVTADRYGLPDERRIEYALVAVEYLVNDAGIEFLSDLHFPAGEQAPMDSCRYLDQYMGDCTRLYNTRELEHMLDVKIVVQQSMTLLYILLAVLLALGVWAWRTGWLPDFSRALGRGGWLTIGLIVAILLFVALAFMPFFIFFHQVFFESGTWMFLWSDTLIRLFPQVFWQNTFITVGMIAAASGLLFGLLLSPFKFKARSKP